MRLALFASGNGSNVKAIIQAVNSGQISATIACIVCDEPAAYVIERAKQADITCFVLARDTLSRQEWEEQVIHYLTEKQVDFIVLAGFMRIIGNTLLHTYPQKIINIHPSLLPQFPGKQSIKDAFDAGVKQTGVTIHWVDSGIDTGDIIAQQALDIQPSWTLAELETAIHTIEHQLYPKTIQEIILSRSSKS